MDPMIGRILTGQKASYKVLDSLKKGSVFKVGVLRPSAIIAERQQAQLAVIKTEPIERNRKIFYQRELDNLAIPAIASSRYVRGLQDYVGHGSMESVLGAPQQRSMVLEWMDTDLWKSRFQTPHPEADLPRIMAKSVLEALAVFADLRGIHTDINPNNVLVSGLETPTPSVKVSDLGNLLLEGINHVRLQALEIRAPEVWKGQGCWPASDVWSLGVTVRKPTFTSIHPSFTNARHQMVHALAAKQIFGASGQFVEGMTEAWCIAKIKRLIGPLGPPVKPEFEEEFAVADILESETYQPTGSAEPVPFITLGTIRQELEKLPHGEVSEECMDFIEHLLVIDHKKRPTAREALKHPYVRGVT
ncbi:MAG: hypothetical protein M4579_004127 [Chaenotheca gracillima]|nr:MAG: hypothetical protein M4579_004127 [Chaenotheca gracillima]